MPLSDGRRGGKLVARARVSTGSLRGTGRAVRRAAASDGAGEGVALLDRPPASGPAQKKAAMSPTVFSRATFPLTRLPQTKIHRAV